MVADGSDVWFVFGVLIVSASDALAGRLLTWWFVPDDRAPDVDATVDLLNTRSHDHHSERRCYHGA